jgi:hypothetical protein
MKKIKLGILSSLIIASSLNGCKKTDLFPLNSIEQSQSFKTVSDAKAWDGGVNNTFRYRFYGGYATATDIQADQLNASLDFGNRNGTLHRWGPPLLADDGAFSAQWSGYYSGLTNINIAIAGYETIPTTTPAQVAELNIYKGNAYFIRAFYYHKLITRFAKPYNAATAASDLGVPLILTFDVNAQPARASVKAIYDQIMADIATAKTLLASIAGTQGAKRPTIDVVTALEARAKLDMKDYTGAYTAANSLILSNRYPLYTTAASLKNYWHVDANQESIMQIFVSRPLELPNTNAVYLGLIPATGKWNPDFIPSQWVLDMYSATDFRKNIYFDAKNVTMQGSDYPGTFLVNKYPGNPVYFTGANTNYVHEPKAFRIAEMYLIAAEAGVTNTTNVVGGTSALNALRLARNLLPQNGLVGQPLIDAVREERFRELAFEGFRLNDLMRYGQGFTRRAPQNINTLTTGADFTTRSITASDNQFIWAIPTLDVTVNPNMVQNPGW